MTNTAATPVPFSPVRSHAVRMSIDPTYALLITQRDALASALDTVQLAEVTMQDGATFDRRAILDRAYDVTVGMLNDYRTGHADRIHASDVVLAS